MLKENKRLKLSFKRAHRVIQFASITCYMIKVILFSSFFNYPPFSAYSSDGQ